MTTGNIGDMHAGTYDIRSLDSSKSNISRHHTTQIRHSSGSASMPSKVEQDCKITKDTGVMILLLGQTGVGKSTFINKVAGRDVANVSDDLRRCTSVVKPFIIEHDEDPQSRVVFVDTPGFNSDGTWLDDNKILKQILDWLQTSCDQDVRFGGILYLHDITTCRDSTGTSVMTSTKLSLPEIARNVLFATVNWKEPESPQQQHREQLMIINWKDMINRGSQVARLESTISPWSIVDKLLKSPVGLGVIRQELNTILGQLSKKPPKEHKWRFSFFHLLHSNQG